MTIIVIKVSVYNKLCIQYPFAFFFRELISIAFLID